MYPFPAEMLRTGATAIKMSLMDIASDNPALRQMGYKRLFGAYLAVKGIGTAAHSLANFVTGNSEEQWECIQKISSSALG